jgi:hypothetical protein
MQIRVRERFRALQKLDEDRIPWEMVDASQSIEDVEEDIWKIASETFKRIEEDGKPLARMWEGGCFDLAFPSYNKEN